MHLQPLLPPWVGGGVRTWLPLNNINLNLCETSSRLCRNRGGRRCGVDISFARAIVDVGGFGEYIVMTQFFNIPQLKQRRRLLRRQPIPSEAKFWMLFRNRQYRGLKFRRQHSIGWYILDFYCSALHLAIEVDGESHLAVGRDVRDDQRQRWIEQQGIAIVRFLSSDVINNFEGVIERLDEVVNEIQNTHLPPYRENNI